MVHVRRDFYKVYFHGADSITPPSCREHRAVRLSDGTPAQLTQIIVVVFLVIAFVLSHFERTRTDVLAYRIVVVIMALVGVLAVFRWLSK
jgi:hypothetical protein